MKPRTRAGYENLLSAKTHILRDGDGKPTADLSIAATFGHRPVNEITRADIADWVASPPAPTNPRQPFSTIIPLCTMYFRERFDYILTVPPLREWPADAREQMRDTCNYVIGLSRELRQKRLES
jgi:hypothetical protein